MTKELNMEYEMSMEIIYKLVRRKQNQEIFRKNMLIMEIQFFESIQFFEKYHIVT